jgi:hypothetical protein
MHHTGRVIGAFSTALILACGALLASAPAAFAATCSGTGCDDTNPYSNGCAGPGASYYVAETTPLINSSTGVASNSYGYIQLWWSNTCHTNWTRMVVNVSGAAFGREDVWIDHYNSAYDRYYKNDLGGAEGAYLTPQIYALGIPAESDGSLYASSGVALYYASVAQPGF